MSNKLLVLPEGTKLIARVRGGSRHFTDGKEYTVVKSTPICTRQPCKVRGDDACWWLQYNKVDGLYFGVTTFKVKEEPAKEYLKVGDKLVASVAYSYADELFTDGKEYAVKEVDRSDARLTYVVETNKYPQWVRTEGDHFEYGGAVLTPVPSEEYLTPHEVLDCMLDDTPLEHRRKDGVTWYDVHTKKVMLSISTVHKYRKKPVSQTMEINGVTVPAPLSKTPEKGSVYTLSIADGIVISLPNRTKVPNVWATGEDAQKVLDAILIPFKNLNAN